jgi:hypothetical protein
MKIPIFTAESAELAEQKWRVETSLRPEWSVLCGMKDLYPCHEDSDGREITYCMPPQREERLTPRSQRKLYRNIDKGEDSPQALSQG